MCSAETNAIYNKLNIYNTISLFKYNPKFTFILAEIWRIFVKI